MRAQKGEQDGVAPTLSFTHDQYPTGWPMLRQRLPAGEELLLEECRDSE